jgi:gamma-glutamyl hercynylcysteine S-oxide synthase
MDSLPGASLVLDASSVTSDLAEARARTLALVAAVSDDDLERVHSPLMSPLVWDLGHIAAFEDLWLVHRYGGRPLLHEDLTSVYDAFETPRAHRGDLPFLRPAEARDYLEEVRARALDVVEERGIGDGILHEMVLRHEHQHGETMLQTMQLAHLGGYRIGESGNGAASNGVPPRKRTPTGLEFVEIPGGEVTIGAPRTGFAYDNERPNHRTDVRGYLLAHTPVTNATYLTFVEGGGYQRREWWSDEGWAWKEDYDISRPGCWTADHAAEWRLGKLEPLHPEAPVVHISWFEADAFARANEARLPTEIEWEKAATWDQEEHRSLPYPWGECPPEPGLHANVDQLSGGTASAGSHPAGASPFGVEDMIGDVWEWTKTSFGGYPGFVPYPYREYSEVFFGNKYKVLRGGSWATRARVASPTFRNWDFPQRRQIFAGVRLARDL